MDNEIWTTDNGFLTDTWQGLASKLRVHTSHEKLDGIAVARHVMLLLRM